ncbi:acyl-CoA synthetase (AMP-forming)/AMP-acid ligase II [Arthrobacter sp. UYCu511]|uniref:AMP-binding enzyme n=1 Tax=Arthrobacter sp. UYCu511 TaxID=3156337 RepID=UPI003399AE89
MIVTGGEVVYSAEVENALSKHPAVASSAVIGVPDEHNGERVHAVVVLAPGAAATAETLRDFCREHIAGYKILPALNSPRRCLSPAQGKSSSVSYARATPRRRLSKAAAASLARQPRGNTNFSTILSSWRAS